MRVKRWTPEAVIDVYERRERGERAADMAKELNVCVSRVYYLSQWGARIVRQRTAKIADKAPPVTDKVSDH